LGQRLEALPLTLHRSQVRLGLHDERPQFSHRRRCRAPQGVGAGEGGRRRRGGGRRARSQRKLRRSVRAPRVGFGRGALHLLLQLRERLVERGHVDGGRGDQARQLSAHLEGEG
jgi:hypothetical protein